VQLSSWVVRRPGEPMDIQKREEHPGPGEAIVQVAGCGVCRTDLEFYFEGVTPRHPYPLTLGHEISGTVVQTGSDASVWMGRSVVVPAVFTCGECEPCRGGQGLVCPRLTFLGTDTHGGFGTHIRVPVRGLCPVPDLDDESINPNRLTLSELCVVAGGMATAYQAILRSELTAGDLAVFIGVGGIGGFGVQLAACFGAAVVAVDVDSERLERLRSRGASLTLLTDKENRREVRKSVRRFAKQHGIPTWRHKVFETSGTPEGQLMAFDLLGPGSVLSVVGFTSEKVKLRLSKLMALEARAQGTWGCPPEHLPALLDLVLSGKVEISTFIERRPLQTINESFQAIRNGETSRNIVLVPDPVPK
jgi:6-hydroxycyclohex-1-ene-1-carbonyl-CoA dehydrogenase